MLDDTGVTVQYYWMFLVHMFQCAVYSVTKVRRHGTGTVTTHASSEERGKDTGEH